MKINNLKLLVLVLLSIGVQSCTEPVEVKSAEDVIKKMEAEYHGKWYPHMTFRQATSFYKGDSLQRQQTWYEAATIGEGLIIKFDSIPSGSGLLFKNDTMYVYQMGKLVQQSFRVHDILELGFNVYKQAPELSIKKLKTAGIDFDFFDQTERHYLLGNPAVKQAFIEKERMVFTKIISINGEKTSRIEFNNYQQLGEGWIAPEVLFFTNDTMTVKEEYFDIKMPETLPGNLFDASRFSEVVW